MGELLDANDNPQFTRALQSSEVRFAPPGAPANGPSPLKLLDTVGFFDEELESASLRGALPENIPIVAAQPPRLQVATPADAVHGVILCMTVAQAVLFAEGATDPTIERLLRFVRRLRVDWNHNIPGAQFNLPVWLVLTKADAYAETQPRLHVAGDRWTLLPTRDPCHPLRRQIDMLETKGFSDIAVVGGLDSATFGDATLHTHSGVHILQQLWCRVVRDCEVLAKSVRGVQQRNGNDVMDYDREAFVN